MSQRPKCKTKTTKFLEENIGEKLHNAGLGSDILDDSKGTRETDKLDFLEIKHLPIKDNTE